MNNSVDNTTEKLIDKENDAPLEAAVNQSKKEDRENYTQESNKKIGVFTPPSITLNPNNASLQGLSSHPYLWDSKQKMLYICEFSNYLETCIDDYKVNKMESHCRKLYIIIFPWSRSLHPTMVFYQAILVEGS